MKWEKLLSRKRLGKKADADSDQGRSEFQRDFDRIAFSSAFRRLQDKTQVFPLSGNDFARTRLTHSLEVSCVGRALGTIIGESILNRPENREPLKDFHSSDIGGIVAAACLAHDIGNPPFGHSGEQAIQQWFKYNTQGKQLIKNFQKNEMRDDFTKFEGNAQGFRILTTIQYPNRDGGLQLTYSTLAAFTKYPTISSEATGEKSKGASTCKHGFFYNDKNIFERIAQELGLIKKGTSETWSRHPLTFLVEAADDICYRIIDFEDGFQLGHISLSEVEKRLKNIAADLFSDDEYAELSDPQQKVEHLRGKALKKLVLQMTDCFLDKEPQILEGNFNEELISHIDSKELLKEIKKITFNKAYKSKEVLKIEAPGFQVFDGLLTSIVSAVDDIAKNDTPQPKSKKIIEFMPGILGPSDKVEKDDYKRLLNVTDYVSGMTDSFAVSTYKTITGMSLPHF